MTELVLDCRDPHGLAQFWSQVLGYRIVDSDEFCLLRGTVAP